jgi:helicase
MVAQLIHPSLEFTARMSRLIVRLELGIPAEAVNLAMMTGDRLSRGDYLSLARARLVDLEKISGTDDSALLVHLAGSQSKLREIRKAVAASRATQGNTTKPIVPLYKA